MIILDDETTGTQTSNRQKDNQQDTRLDSLQSAVNSLNSDITSIETSITAIQNSIVDNYTAQTQNLMSALNTQIQNLINNLEDFVNTTQINADVGNFKTLVSTLSTNLVKVVTDVLRVTSSATIASATITNETVESSQIQSLRATAATIQEATITLLHMTELTVTTLNASTVNADEFIADSVESDEVDSDVVKAKNITGKEWQTPISTPDNTELLHIAIPKYNGVILLQTQDNEFSVTIFNNVSVAVNQRGEYVYRVERNANSVDLYLQNIGDTVNYRLLYIGSESYQQSISEIVDRTDYEQNVEDLQIFAFFDGDSVISVGEFQKKITGAASTITENNLAPNRVMISNADGKADNSAITTDELSALANVASNIQEQLDNLEDEKQDKILENPITLAGYDYSTMESAISAIVSVLNGLITDDIIYNEIEEELIFPYNSISYDNEELTISGFNVSVVGEEITFTR